MLGRHRAALQLRIKKGARGAQQPQLQRQQLSVGRLVRLHDVLGVQCPAFGVGGVERVLGARQAHALLDHGIELQLVTGARLVRGERPGDRVESEVIVAVRRAAIRGRDIERQHELAALAGVVHQRRRRHVRGGLARRLRRGRQADDRRPVGQRHQVVRHDELLDLVQAVVEERQDRIAGDLLLLQLTDHGAVVLRGVVIGARHLRGERCHLRLVLGKCRVRHGGDLRRRDVDPVLLEIECILFRRQAEIRARLGQDVLAHPAVVVRQLRLEFLEGGLPALQAVLFAQLRHAVEIIRVASELGLDLALRGVDNSRLRHLLLHTLLQDLGEGAVATLQARVAAQPRQCRRPPLGGHLLIEQRAHALEYHGARIEERHLVLELVVLAAKAQIERLVEDVEVLLHALIGLGAACGIHLSHQRLELVARGELVGERRVGDALVVLRQSLSRALLGRVLELHVEELAGVGVAALDPGALGMGGARVPGGLRRVRHEAHQERTGQMAHPRLPTDTPQYRGATL